MNNKLTYQKFILFLRDSIVEGQKALKSREIPIPVEAFCSRENNSIESY